ncbi:uncharacterized protein Triagg1_5668 [Trichoderma aggressivum f. europaeum]|uniref:Uncharacterized protein n=1 Tax=Trichoderma aggressivum f. europaeum TaxID=173218 RepID=A0AAE1IGB4_9HYPO|nr:hypothetical protein Triagg1_5668 [Trichoderma aggressivum f. europaeum]
MSRSWNQPFCAMDGTTSPGWGSGNEPVVNNLLPASFVTFFPAAHEAKTEMCVSDRPTTTSTSPSLESPYWNQVLTRFPDSSWADNLVAQKPATILRAWCRVPVAAGPSTLRKGMTIMKRVGRVARVVAASQAAAEIEVPEGAEETQRANRRRLDSFVPTAEAVLELVGEPLSRAEVASAVMRAKVDVANCYLHEEYTDVSEQRNLAKQSQYTKKTVPLRRRFNTYSSVDFEYASGGNGYAIYSELHPILSRAMQGGVTEIDVNMASITEAGVHLRSMSRNPRVPLAASGMPELSDIADDSEPSSVLTLEPNESMSDAKSPTKRASTQSPSPTKSSKSFRKRLSDTIVRLLPGSFPRAEPSPIKPSSPPTPNMAFESPRQQTPSISIPKSPSASKSPLLSANSTPGLIRWSNRSSKESPFARWRPKRKSEPARLSTTPSPPRNDSSTFDVSMEDGSIMFGSPVHQSRPNAPTPSKWSGLLSSTPIQQASSAAVTPANDGASLGLVKSLPEWMQHTQSPATLEKSHPSNIDFRPASPSFTSSVSWVNVPTDTIEVERTKIVRRRKSEPLVRNMLKSHSLRRTSLSPQKPRSGGAMPTVDEPTFPSHDSISRIPEHSQLSNFFNSSATQSNTLSNTLNNAATEQNTHMDAQGMEPQGVESDDPHGFGLLAWNYKAQIEDVVRERRNAPPPVRHPDDVFDDPNDRYRRESPPPHDPVKRLARFAENGCYDKAGVTIARREGRLLVQFKLPIKHMYLFPQNYRDQGSPEPESDDFIPQFHREFPGETPEPPSPEHRQRSEWSSSPLAAEESHLADKTLVVSDFGGSPTKQTSASAENEESHLMNETLVVSDFGSPAKHSPSPDHKDSYPSDETLIVSDFVTSPAKRGSSSRQSVANSSPAPTSQKSPYTPADQLIIPDYLTTSERKVYKPGMVYKPDMNSPPLVPSELATNPELPTNSELAVNTDSSSLSDLENTPPLNESSELSIAIMAAENVTEQSASADPEPSPTDSTTTDDPTSTSPISFTPVNQAGAQKKAASPTLSNKQGSPTSPESGRLYPISHDDTPERNFLRDFIRRSRPRRLSTTETGSPIAPVQRQPLGARSPNMETQPKEKRKFESSEGEGNENEPETQPEPAPKRIRRVHRTTPPKPKAVTAMNHSDDEDPLAKDVAPTNDAADELANDQEKKEASVPAASRRSSRLKTKPSAIPKPSVPAPTRVGRGRPPNATLGSVRNEQQDLVHQTRANTRRNKGNAEYPAQFLARHSEEEEGEASQQDEAEASKAGRGKSVVWKEPLESYQEEERPKRGRPSAAAKEAKAKAKAKAKAAGNRISKPAAKPSAAAQKQRSSRIAAGLGMAGNGTPAPKRATRASTRARK